MTSSLKRMGTLLESIKFSHSVFALPFALIAMLLATRGRLPTVAEFLGIVGAMVGARTWAMAVNRVVDAEIDKRNPRTATRAIPDGQLSKGSLLALGILGAVLFLGCAFWLSPLAFWLGWLVLIVLGFYSYTKRFTFFCHYWLGLCLGMAPMGAWVALRGEISADVLVLSLGVCCWVAGFDILYALQDREFDTAEKLHSIPARFGVTPALFVARISHLFAAVAFALFGVRFVLGGCYFGGLAIAVLLMMWEHWLVRKGNLSRINMAFFNLNGWVSVLLFVATGMALLVR